MIRHITTRTVRGTRELAKQFSAMKGSPGERPLKRRHIRALRAIYENGLFHSPVWATCRVLENGITYRIDGQHSSTMLAGVDHDLPVASSCIIKEFECDQLKELAQVFACFDNPISTRTRPEIAKAYGAVHAELKDIAASVIYDCVCGMAFAHFEGHDDRLDAERRNRLVNDNVGFIAWVAPWAMTRVYRRRGIIAAMYETYRVDSKMADRFWQLVGDASNADPNHPTRTYNILLETSYAGRTDPKFRKLGSHRALFAKGISAWNAWCDGRVASLSYRADRDIPRVLVPDLLKIDIATNEVLPMQSEEKSQSIPGGDAKAA